MKIIHDKLKVHSLTGRITEKLMLKAFKAVKKNRGAAGIDGISIQTFELNLTEGTCQGGVISPLLSNIALDHLDWFLESKDLRFARYADDFVIMCKSKPDAKRALDLAATFKETYPLHEIQADIKSR